MSGNGPDPNNNPVTAPQTDADVFAFLEGLDGPSKEVTEPEPGADAGSPDQGKQPVADADADPASSPLEPEGDQGKSGDGQPPAPAEGAPPPAVDYKAKFEESERQRSAAMRELNERWAREKRERENPRPPAAEPDPVREKIAQQRADLELRKGLVDTRLEEAKKIWPDKDPEDLAGYAEHWGEQDYLKQVIKRENEAARAADPYVQRIQQTEKAERVNTLKTILEDNAALVKDPEINPVLTDVLKRRARELETAERKPGRYLTPDGQFTPEFEERDGTADLVRESIDLAVGRAKRESLKSSIKSAVEQGMKIQQEASRKKQIRTVVPIGTGRGSSGRPNGGASGVLDDFNKAIVNAG